MKDPIRILIADDHTVVRGGIRALIEVEDEIVVIGEAADGVEVVSKAQLLNPDVILIDLQMPRKSGIQAISEITMSNPSAKVLVLTSYSDEEKVFAAIKAGALGYILKGARTC
ncbi:MAG: response regulator transcription factor [Chloroflexi bacterium]|nr:response regulator transcription factor [Chloroflexota bacterium]